jgi:carbonic anhydrase
MRSDPSGVDPAVVGREHLRETVDELLHASTIIAEAVAAGRLGVVAGVYQLGEGTVVPHVVEGAVTIAAAQTIADESFFRRGATQ